MLQRKQFARTQTVRLQKMMLLISVLLLTLFVSACTAAESGSGDEPTAEPSPTQIEPAERARQMWAEQSERNVDAIEIVSVEEREWSDSCLGLGGPAESCLQVIVPGYLVVLRAGEAEATFHTDLTGDVIRMEEPMSAESALMWSRSGGIAGFCDSLEIGSDNMATAIDCKDTSTTGTPHFELDSEQAAQLNTWQKQFASFDTVQSDGAVADSMTITLRFNGRGSEVATDAQQSMIAQWASEQYTAHMLQK